MRAYPIKNTKKDFKFLDVNYNIKGSRVKKIIVDKYGKKAFFKYERSNYNASEACSEKMSYEIAKILNYDCAKIELARDSNGNLGVLNYFFIDIGDGEHVDAVAFLNIYNHQRANFYTISNIKKTLDNLDKNLFRNFIKIMIFDCLIGEQDRHEENWGVLKINGKYKLSPLYDNGCNLLREFRNSDLAEQYYNNKKSFDAYINRSKSMIYKEDNCSKYGHFELIEYLNKIYHVEVQHEIVNLEKLTDKKIEMVVNKIPNELLTMKHKEYIIIYLKKRRDKILNID